MSDSARSHIHMNYPHLAPVFSKWVSAKLESDDIEIPLHLQPINPEEEDGLVPDKQAIFNIMRSQINGSYYYNRSNSYSGPLFGSASAAVVSASQAAQEAYNPENNNNNNNNNNNKHTWCTNSSYFGGAGVGISGLNSNLYINEPEWKDLGLREILVNPPLDFDSFNDPFSTASSKSAVRNLNSTDSISKTFQRNSTQCQFVR